MDANICKLWDLYKRYDEVVGTGTRSNSIDYEVLDTLLETAIHLETVQTNYGKLKAKYKILTDAFKEVE